jgi:hypothetical protein
MDACFHLNEQILGTHYFTTFGTSMSKNTWRCKMLRPLIKCHTLLSIPYKLTSSIGFGYPLNLCSPDGRRTHTQSPALTHNTESNHFSMDCTATDKSTSSQQWCCIWQRFSQVLIGSENMLIPNNSRRLVQKTIPWCFFDLSSHIYHNICGHASVWNKSALHVRASEASGSSEAPDLCLIIRGILSIFCQW